MSGSRGFAEAAHSARPVAPKPPGPLWHTLTLIAVLSSIVLGAAYLLTAQYCDSQHADAERILMDGVKSASTEMRRWLDEGSADVEVIAMQAGMAERYMRWKQGEDPQFERLVADRIETERRIRGYRFVAMYTLDGKPFAVAPKDAVETSSAAYAAFVSDALAADGSIFADHIHNEAGEWLVAWAAPMRLSSDGTAVGAMMYTQGIQTPASAILGDNELPFETGAVALVRSDAGDFDVLSSEFGFKPVSIPEGPEVHAKIVELARSSDVALEYGLDEEGTAIIAAGTPIPGTSWVAAAKVDQAEINAPVFRYAALTGLSSLLMVFGIAIVGLTARRTREVRYREHADYLKLQDALDARDNFLANMSHELRTPLHSIMGFTSIMLSGLAGPINEEQQRQLTMVDESSKRLLALVDDVLDISKIRAGHTQVVATRFTAGEVEQTVCSMMQPLYELKSLELMRYVPDPALRLNTDRDMVERIVLNLLSNALKFTDQGYVRFEIKKDGPDHAIFQVLDTGQGIPENELERVMEEFHQVVEPRGVKPVGTGLGLAISRRMAEALGGYLAVESVVGEGSRFWLRIPRVHPQAE